MKVGLGFQIADDILDVSASSGQLGKTAGKDAKAGKATYPAVVGMEESWQLAKRLADEAVAQLEPFGPEADTLRQLAEALLRRGADPSQRDGSGRTPHQLAAKRGHAQLAVCLQREGGAR